MMLKLTLLTIALAISGSYAHCPHHGGNIGWRNEPMWRRWGVHPAWRLSSFGDMFDEDWPFYHPQHQIFSTYEYPHHMKGDGVDMIPEHCQEEREQRENQYRLEEEQARKHELDSLNREEEELEWQQISEEFQREQAEFQQRKIISQQKAGHDIKHSETTPSNEAETRQPTISRSQQLEEQQRVASEQRRKQQAEQEAKMLQREAIRKYKQAQRHARQRDRIELARHQVTGYDPDDITVTIDEERIKIEGRHVCHCNEKCITREFARSYPLAIDINPDSLSATMDEQGTVKISAERNRGERNSESRRVKVEGLGIPQSTKPSVDQLRTCLGKKGGIKLSKVNKRTGKAHVDDYKYDHEVLRNNQPMGTDYEEGFVETEDY